MYKYRNIIKSFKLYHWAASDYHETQTTYLPLEIFYQHVLNHNPPGCRREKLTNTVKKLIKEAKSLKGIRLVLIQLIFPFSVIEQSL